jgi:MoxR-like ATPase
MPMDITGSNILNEHEGIKEMKFHPGPIFGNMVLADEINRASPKTQAALLEAMQEKKVTVLGTTHVLPEPFAVLATQNPIELEGTYPLPEAQIDRFLFKLNVFDVNADTLTDILLKLDDGELPELSPILSRDEMLEIIKEAKKATISEPVASYIARLVSATHPDEHSDTAKLIKFGASPRAAISMSKAARVIAFMDNRNTVGFEDVKAIAMPVLRHRIILDYSAKIEGITQDSIVEKILSEVSELQKDAPSSIVERIVDETE